MVARLYIAHLLFLPSNGYVKRVKKYITLTPLIKFLDIPLWLYIRVRNAVDLIILLHAFWNITNFGAKCEKCETINTITLEMGELKKQA